VPPLSWTGESAWQIFLARVADDLVKQAENDAGKRKQGRHREWLIWAARRMPAPVIKAMIESYIKEESAAFLAERGDEDP
jgi:hypothetical protein